MSTVFAVTGIELLTEWFNLYFYEHYVAGVGGRVGVFALFFHCRLCLQQILSMNCSVRLFFQRNMDISVDLVLYIYMQ